MAGTGTRITGTGESIAGVDVNWLSSISVQSFASTNATAALTSAQRTDVLRCTNFDFSSLASTDTIVGITVRVYAGITAGSDGDITFNSVQLVLSGSTQGNDLDAAESLNTSFAWFYFGGSSNLWGATPSISDVQNSAWGVNVTFVEVDVGTVGVRAVTMSIHTANTRNRRHIGGRGRRR